MSGYNDEAMHVKSNGKLGGAGHELTLNSNLVRRTRMAKKAAKKAAKKPAKKAAKKAAKKKV
jgi:hypothetical protein